MHKSWWMNGPLRDPDPAPGGGGPPAFDYAALVKAMEGTIEASIKKLLPQAPPAPPPTPPPTPEPEPKPGDDKHAAALKKLQTELAAEKAAREDATKKGEEKDRHAQIRSALSDFDFNEKARETAFRIFRDEVKRGADGDSLVGPDGETPFAQYIKDQMEKEHDYLLKPIDRGGTGAMNVHGSKREPAIDINEIKPGMSAEQRKRAWAETLAQLNQGR